MINLSLLILAGLIVLEGCSGSPSQGSYPSHPQRPVEIRIDRYGIPHIRGESQKDIAFAQGYIQAELRPAQIENFRLQSQGRRSEVFGKGALNQDILIRALNFYGFAQKEFSELRRLYPEIAQNFEAFSQGINLKYQEYRKEGWPPTLQLFVKRGYDPSPWRAEEIYGIALLLAFGLSGVSDIKIEATLAKLLLGPKVFEDFIRFAPATTSASAKEFYRIKGIRSSSKTSPLSSEHVLQIAGNQDLESIFDDPSWIEKTLSSPRSLSTSLKRLRDLFHSLSRGGSNCFGISARFTANGVAYLASDTHQGLDTPGPYLIMHLILGQEETPEWSVIGSSFPGAPGIVFGHNGNVAWAPTNGNADTTDFYIERFSSPEKESVLRRDSPPVRVNLRREEFRIYTPDGFSLKTLFIRDIPGWGPILPLEEMGVPLPFPISLRWTGFTIPGPAGTIFGFMQGRKIEDLLTALQSFSGPSLGFCFADTTGRVAYSYWTRIPIREKSAIFSPMFIIPATIGPLWTGFLPLEVVPFLVDPEKGYVFAANGDPVGNTFDNDPFNDPYYYGFGYDVGFRSERLENLLKEAVSTKSATMETAKAIQLDRKSLLKFRVVPFLEQAAENRPDLATPELKDLISSLSRWDGDTGGDRFEPALFYTFWMIFLHDVLLDKIFLLTEPDFQLFTRTALYWLERTKESIDQIEAGELAFPSSSGLSLFDRKDTPEKETRDEMLLKALKKAVEHLSRLFPDRPIHQIRWSDLLILRLDHDLITLDPSLDTFTREWGIFGGLDTVSVADFSIYSGESLRSRYILSNAPSNRYIWELSPSGIRSLFMIASGQSELPKSPHFFDLPEDYVHLRYHEFPYLSTEVGDAQEFIRILK